MTAIVASWFCVGVLMTACSTDVFFALLGATSRLHDLLAVFRATTRMLLTVTSPFKIGLTVLALMAVFTAESSQRTRGLALIAIAGLIFGSIVATPSTLGVRLDSVVSVLCLAAACCRGAVLLRPSSA